jgi:hypothetical protein
VSGVLDDLLVGLVVLAGFGYAGYSLGPKSLRARVLTGAAWLLRRAPVPPLRRAAERMAAGVGKAGGACGGCDDCGSNAANRSGAPQGGAGTAPDIRIPLAKIGKRPPR